MLQIISAVELQELQELHKDNIHTEFWDSAVYPVDRTGFFQYAICNVFM